MASYDYDVIVIGGGAGGSIAAQQLAKAGKSVAIVESTELGGHSAQFGSIPFQAMQRAAKLYEAAKHGSRMGVRGATVGYNYPSIRAWKDLVVKRTGVAHAEEHYGALGINTVHGRGYFIDPHTITVGNARFSAEKFLIATGSELTLPEVSGLSEAGFLTIREALELSRPPKSLVIIGGTPDGCELAELFATFGTKVYLLEPGPKLLPQEEPETSSFVTEQLSEQYSVSTLFEATVEAVQKIGQSKRVSVLVQGKSKTILADEVLLATPERPALDIGLENAGVTYEEIGILTNDTLQTSANHIYAAGSCTSAAHASPHLATYQSQVAAHNILHQKPTYVEYRAIPRVIRLSPEVAAVGPTEQEIKKQKVAYRSATAPLSVLTKANVANTSDGFVKLLVSSKTGVILGGTIVCPEASEIIGELALAAQNYMLVSHLARTIHPFSTWSEALRVVASKLVKD